MWFCPYCGSLLQVRMLGDADNRAASYFDCQCCPYRRSISTKQRERINLTPKPVDSVLGGSGAWDNVDKTTVDCTRAGCGGGEAFFMQIQIRSADEPMSTFYKCVKCGEQWCHR